MATVNLVVTCTKRKTAPPAQSLMLRHLPRLLPDDRIAAWLHRINRCTEETHAVRDLYSGDHWTIARDLDGVSIAPRSRLRLWVVSAGYGLLRPDDEIHSYSATFAVRHPDSVVGQSSSVNPQQSQRQWWQRLTEWEWPRSGEPRSIAALAAEWPRSPLIVVASEVYLQSLRDDLWEARTQLAAPQWLSIVSAGSRELDGMTDHLVPCDARLGAMVGGARRSLNLRAARMVLSNIGTSQPTLPLLRDRFAELLAKAPALTMYHRKPLNDAEVVVFIRRSLRDDPLLRATPLLRRLRDDGFACEYSRFMSLYRATRE